jgi:hypothetical protein
VRLIAPVPQEWVPAGDLAHFVTDLIETGALNLPAVYVCSEERRGYPPYDPRLMAKLLVYSHANAMMSSRRVEAATYRDVAGADAVRRPASQPPLDHALPHAIARRSRNCPSKNRTGVQAAAAGGAGDAGVNGTNLRANASRHKTMSYERTTKKETELEGEIAALRQNVDALRMAGTTADRLPYSIGCPITWLPPRPRALPVTPASGPSVPESEEAAARSEAVHAPHPHQSAARTSSIHAIAAIAVGKPAVEIASSAV